MKLTLVASLFLLGSLASGRQRDSISRSSLEHFQNGERLFAENKYQGAGLEFISAIKGDLQPRWTLVWSYVELGKVYDVAGIREKAVQEYNRALQTGDNTRGALDEAKKYLNVPFSRN